MAVLSATGYHRTLVEFAVWFAGGITVPLVPDLPAAQLTGVLQDSDVRRIFTQDAADSHQVAGVLESADLPAERIISTVRMDYDGDAPNLASLAAASAGVSDAELERHRSAATAADTASSGATAASVPLAFLASGITAGGGLRAGRLFDAAARAAVEYSRAGGTDGAAGPAAAAERPAALVAVRHAVLDRLVYRKLRAALGGQLGCIYTTDGILPADTVRFFDAAGIPGPDSYGRDATSGPFAVSTPQRSRPETVGLPLPGTTVRIAADGEVLAKGIGIFAGYHEDPSATSAAFGGDFFHTGVTGSLDDDGYLTLSRRKQEDPPG